MKGVFVILAAVCLTSSVAAQDVFAAPKQGSYAGTTSEKAPITFKVASGGKKITAVASTLGYDGKCGAGGGPGFSFVAPSAPIGTGGKFAVTVKAHAGTATGVIQISGVIAGANAHGTISEPKPFFTCKAPNQHVNPYSETFTAKAR